MPSIRQSQRGNDSSSNVPQWMPRAGRVLSKPAELPITQALSSGTISHAAALR